MVIAKINLNDGGVIENVDTIEDAQVLTSLGVNIVTAEATEVVRLAEVEAKYVRDVALKAGVTSADGVMWFSEETLQMFVGVFATLDGAENVVWRDANKASITLTQAEAKVYAKEARVALQALYGL